MDRKKVSKFKDKLNVLAAELEDSQFFQKDFLAKLYQSLKEKDLGQIVCYGLGSFTNGIELSSRYQLALLLNVYWHCKKKHSQTLSTVIRIYDPSFEENDVKILKSFQEPTFHFIENNEYCAYKLHKSQGCCLIYMPHLDKFFYNNLIGINWTSDLLSNIIVLGNSFQEMIDSEISSNNRAKLHYLQTLVSGFRLGSGKGKSANKKHGPIEGNNIEIIGNTTNRPLIELPLLDNLFEHSNIFNSFSFHYLDKTWLDNNSKLVEDSKLPNWEPCHGEFCEEMDDALSDWLRNQ